MTPMLIVVPFWAGDKAQAMDLCKIIAGLQTHHVGPVAHVMLAARQDCNHDQNMIKIVMAKFNTFTYITRSPLRGWPEGPNGMFGNTMIHISNNGKNKYECVYWMEPDAIPLCPNWFADLLQAWRSRHINAKIVGCRGQVDESPSSSHITGCALYHPNIARLMPYLMSCTSVAWDWKHRAEIVANGGHTPLIENWYKATNLPEDIVNRCDQGVRILHGAKDRSVVISVAKKYKININ